MREAAEIGLPALAERPNQNAVVVRLCNLMRGGAEKPIASGLARDFFLNARFCEYERDREKQKKAGEKEDVFVAAEETSLRPAGTSVIYVTFAIQHMHTCILAITEIVFAEIRFRSLLRTVLYSRYTYVYFSSNKNKK